jgi:hypothetical protein
MAILVVAMMGAAVSLCELTAKPHAHAGSVTVTGVFASGYHGSYLYDPACNRPDSAVDVACDGTTDTTQCEEGLDRIGDKGRRARVRLEGTLVGWDGLGYGHLNGFRRRFDIMRVLSAETVPEEEPWPEPRQSHFMSSVQELLLLNADLVAGLVGPGRAGFSGLPEEFRAQLSDGTRVGPECVEPASPPPCHDVSGFSTFQRVFPADQVAFVQGGVQCEGGTRDYHPFVVVYSRNSGGWRPILGEVSWLRPRAGAEPPQAVSSEPAEP